MTYEHTPSSFLLLQNHIYILLPLSSSLSMHLWKLQVCSEECVLVGAPCHLLAACCIWDHGRRWSVLGGPGLLCSCWCRLHGLKWGPSWRPFGCVAWVPYSSCVPSWGHCRASGICSEVLDGNSFVKEAIYNSSSHF